MMLAPSLVALGVGYLVYITASKEKEGVKLLGQVIGIFVMIASVLAVACSAMHCRHKEHQCSMGDKKECPMMSAKSATCSMAGHGEEK